MQNHINMSSSCSCSTKEKGDSTSPNNEIKKTPCKNNCPNCSCKNKKDK